MKLDRIKEFDSLSNKISPDRFLFKRFVEHVLFYRIFYKDNDETPYLELIAVDKDLHVKLHYKNSHVPLPSWFKMAQYKMTRHLLSEIYKIMHFKQQGCPPYSPEVFTYTKIYVSASVLSTFRRIPATFYIFSVKAGIWWYRPCESIAVVVKGR